MPIDDAIAFLVDYMRRPRPGNGYPSFGYEIYLPNVVVAYIVEAERSAEHLSTIYSGARARQLSPSFYEAAWDLSRRGVLRPGVKEFGGQSAGEGEGYTVTSIGRKWLTEAADTFVLLEPTRLGRFCGTFSETRSGLFATSKRGRAVPHVRFESSVLRYVRRCSRVDPARDRDSEKRGRSRNDAIVPRRSR